MARLEEMEKVSGKKFGDTKNPLLVSARSGAKYSMPGMMDTILNIGLTDKIVDALAVGDTARFWRDSYRRLLQMYGDVVEQIKDENGEDPFEETLGNFKKEKGAKTDLDLTADDLAELIKRSMSSMATSSRRIRRNRLWPPQKPFSVRGTTSAPSSPASSKVFLTASAPPSTFRKWSLVTAHRVPQQVFTSPATRSPASSTISSMVPFCSRPRAKTSSPVSATPCLSKPFAITKILLSMPFMKSSKPLARNLSINAATCRIPSSRSKKSMAFPRCTSSRSAMASVRLRLNP